jgi:ornithine decarboxylase
MKWMTELHPNLGFDCASYREIVEARPLVPAHRILYAQPCKIPGDIQKAQDAGIRTTVVDSVEEVEKMAGWKGQALVRLLVPDGDSKQPFGKKFGAPLAWVRRIAEAARYHKVMLSGFSFHVGSECQNPEQYVNALEECRKAMEVTKALGFGTETVDIGGGFLPEASSFVAVATRIRHVQKSWDPAVHWIAEPGRFLAMPTHTLYTQVIGKKPVWPPPLLPTEAKWRITIDESVYGAFSNIPFDHQAPKIERDAPFPSLASAVKRPTVVFGRTCDSGDCLGEAIMLPEVAVGDVLRIPDMGAYTTVTASEFNGFPKPRRVYELA